MKQWINPLSERYASKKMLELWGPEKKFSTWRRIWLALAEAQQEVGLARITDEQLAEMRENITKIDFKRASQYEQCFQHDVMAHIHTFADCCPKAREIIHLGATSCDITDNADLLIIRESLKEIIDRLVGLMTSLAIKADDWIDIPTLGYTHYQPAQLTTVGKRFCMWCQEVVMDIQEIEKRIEGICFRGIKGAVGTQASFVSLFNGRKDLVEKVELLVANKLGFSKTAIITGQTYSRKFDSQILDALSGFAQSSHKFATDLRLLQHDEEMQEAFGDSQVGSSAMSYKKNPISCERICGLSRFVMDLASSAHHTAAVQWLERSLDDSSNRRLTLPQAFLTTDAVISLYYNVVVLLKLNRKTIERRVKEHLPLLMTESMLMTAVNRGGDRQELHEKIRVASKEDAENIVARLEEIDPIFQDIQVNQADLIGCAVDQVVNFIANVVTPIRLKYRYEQET